MENQDISITNANKTDKVKDSDTSIIGVNEANGVKDLNIYTIKVDIEKNQEKPLASRPMMARHLAIWLFFCFFRRFFFLSL